MAHSCVYKIPSATSKHDTSTRLMAVNGERCDLGRYRGSREDTWHGVERVIDILVFENLKE
ncbi:unnamed protein product [Dovyalis caffra]|uniref:Uncharacterized protein n=1 Tax=Dovyalis caffra TaxID=77055 RepID=A0AAV1QWU6_9ROSI|nr:unnamed protein product [Dovyalis caffra]